MTATLNRSGKQFFIVSSGGGGSELLLFLLAHGDHALGEHRGVVLSILITIIILYHPLTRALPMIISLLQTDLIIELIIDPVLLWS